MRTRSDFVPIVYYRVKAEVANQINQKTRQTAVKTHLVIVHPPQLDLPVVCSADDEGHARVEIGPVHSPDVTQI